MKMIESFKTIELWNQDDLLKIPEHLNMGINEIVTEYCNDKFGTTEIKRGSEASKLYINLINSFRNHTKDPKAKRYIKFNMDFTELFMYIYQKKNKIPFKGRITVMHPDSVSEERKKRDIISRDFQIEYPEYKLADVMNIFQGKSKARLDFLIDFTNYVQGIERDLLDLPPSKGVRWDFEEWIRTSNIPVKHSWEQEYD